MLHCSLKVPWKVASDLRVRFPFPNRNLFSQRELWRFGSGDVALSVIVIVRCWYAKFSGAIVATVSNVQLWERMHVYVHKDLVFTCCLMLI